MGRAEQWRLPLRVRQVTVRSAVHGNVEERREVQEGDGRRGEEEEEEEG